MGVCYYPGDKEEILDYFLLVLPWEQLVVAVVGFPLPPGFGPGSPPSKLIKGNFISVKTHELKNEHKWWGRWVYELEKSSVPWNLHPNPGPEVAGSLTSHYIPSFQDLLPPSLHTLSKHSRPCQKRFYLWEHGEANYQNGRLSLARIPAEISN